MEGVSLASKRKRPPAAQQANPTPERLARARGAYEFGDDRQRPVLTMRDSPLERAHDRRAITQAQYDAGVKYRLHWQRAGMAGNTASLDVDRVFGGAGAGLQGAAFDTHHETQYRKAVRHLGLQASKFLEDIVCREVTPEAAGYALGWGSKPQAIAAAMERLKMGLDELCELWGLR